MFFALILAAFASPQTDPTVVPPSSYDPKSDRNLFRESPDLIPQLKELKDTDSCIKLHVEILSYMSDSEQDLFHSAYLSQKKKKSADPKTDERCFDPSYVGLFFKSFVTAVNTQFANTFTTRSVAMQNSLSCVPRTFTAVGSPKSSDYFPALQNLIDSQGRSNQCLASFVNLIQNKLNARRKYLLLKSAVQSTTFTNPLDSAIINFSWTPDEVNLITPAFVQFANCYLDYSETLYAFTADAQTTLSSASNCTETPPSRVESNVINGRNLQVSNSTSQTQKTNINSFSLTSDQKTYINKLLTQLKGLGGVNAEISNDLTTALSTPNLELKNDYVSTLASYIKNQPFLSLIRSFVRFAGTNENFFIYISNLSPTGSLKITNSDNAPMDQFITWVGKPLSKFSIGAVSLETGEILYYAFSSDPVNGNFFDFTLVNPSARLVIEPSKGKVAQVSQCSKYYSFLSNSPTDPTVEPEEPTTNSSNCVSSMKPLCQTAFNQECKNSGFFGNMKGLTPSATGFKLPAACSGFDLLKTNSYEYCFIWIAQNLFKNSLFPRYSNILNIHDTIIKSQIQPSRNLQEATVEEVNFSESDLTLGDLTAQINPLAYMLAATETVVDGTSSQIQADTLRKVAILKYQFNLTDVPVPSEPVPVPDPSVVPVPVPDPSVVPVPVKPRPTTPPSSFTPNNDQTLFRETPSLIPQLMILNLNDTCIQRHSALLSYMSDSEQHLFLSAYQSQNQQRSTNQTTDDRCFDPYYFSVYFNKLVTAVNNDFATSFTIKSQAVRKSLSCIPKTFSAVASSNSSDYLSSLKNLIDSQSRSNQCLASFINLIQNRLNERRKYLLLNSNLQIKTTQVNSNGTITAFTWTQDDQQTISVAFINFVTCYSDYPETLTAFIADAQTYLSRDSNCQASTPSRVLNENIFLQTSNTTVPTNSTKPKTNLNTVVLTADQQAYITKIATRINSLGGNFTQIGSELLAVLPTTSNYELKSDYFKTLASHSKGKYSPTLMVITEILKGKKNCSGFNGDLIVTASNFGSMSNGTINMISDNHTLSTDNVTWLGAPLSKFSMAAGCFEKTGDFFTYAFSSDPVNGNFFDFAGGNFNLGKAKAAQVTQCSKYYSLLSYSLRNMQNTTANSTVAPVVPSPNTNNCISSMKSSCQSTFNQQCKLSSLFRNLVGLVPSASGVNLPNACQNINYMGDDEQPFKNCFTWIAQNLFRNSLFPRYSSIINIQVTITNSQNKTLRYLQSNTDLDPVIVVDKDLTTVDNTVQMDKTVYLLTGNQTVIDGSSPDAQADTASKVGEVPLPNPGFPSSSNEPSSLGSYFIAGSPVILLLLALII